MGVGQEDAGAGCCDSASVGGCSPCSSSNSICSSNSSTKNCSSNTDRGSKPFASSECAGTTDSDSCACSAAFTSNNTQSSSSDCTDRSGSKSCPTSANRVSASSSSSSIPLSGDAESPSAGGLVLPALKITFYEAVLQQLINDNLLDTARSLASTLRLRSIAPSAKDHLYRLYIQTLFLPPAAAATAHLPSAAEVALAEVTAAKANQAQGRGAAATYAGRVDPSAEAAALDVAAGPCESGRGASPCDSDRIRVAASAGAAGAACATRQQNPVVALAAERPLAFAAAAGVTPTAAAAAAEMVLGAAAQQDAGRSAPWSDRGAAAQFPPQPWVPLLTRAVLPPAACKGGAVRLLSYATGAAVDFSAAADTRGKPYTHTADHSTQPELQQEPDQQQRGAATFHRRRRRSSSSSVGSLRSRVETVLAEEVRASITFQAPCISAACSPDLRLVAGGGRDATVRIMDVAPTRSLRMRVYHGHIGPVTALALHPTRDLCFSGSTDCTVKIYDVSSKSMRSSSSAGLPIASFQDAHAIECLTVHPCGDFLYVGTTHPIIRLYDLQTSRCFTCLAAAAHQQQRICDLRCSADGAILASASADGTIHFFDAVDGKLVNRIPAAHSGMPVTSVRWSRTGRYLLSSGVDGQSRIWDVRSGKQVLVMGEGVRGRSPKIVATFLSNEAYIAQMSLGAAGGLRYYGAHTGSEVASKSSTGVDVLVNALESAPLEMTLVTAGSDAKTRLVYVRESEAERDLELSTA